MGDVTATVGEDSTVQATHLTGDLYFINRFRRRYWYIAAALCLLVPPAGVFLATYFIASGVVTRGEEVSLNVAEA